jgi:hypothetical protein
VFAITKWFDFQFARGRIFFGSGYCPLVRIAA